MGVLLGDNCIDLRLPLLLDLGHPRFRFRNIFGGGAGNILKADRGKAVPLQRSQRFI